MDLAYKFWKKYVNADLIERDKMLKKMVKFGLWQELFKMSKIKKKIDGLTMQEYCLKTNLMSYFDDIIDCMYSNKIDEISGRVDKAVAKKTGIRG